MVPPMVPAPPRRILTSLVFASLCPLAGCGGDLPELIQDGGLPPADLDQLPAPPPVEPPPLRREFRAAWVATVSNIDWPSRRGLSAAAQQGEALSILDAARALRLSAVILQVRPACDALYASTLEPWSPYLAGASGRPPSPYYDPLAFWVSEAHRRGLELHAWFNPYRAALPGQTDLDPLHIVRRRPDLAPAYGDYRWLDPGEPEVQAHTLGVVLDVVRRYDIDGVHLDDYFYPYPSYGGGKDFPDDASYKKYRDGGGALLRADWRRQNVNQLVQRLRDGIKEVRPTVRFGISPFGIWRPGSPPPIQGLDAYSVLYADSRLWLNQGWVDYLAPQLYWPIAQTAQSYTTLLDWWIGENKKGVHLWPGNSLTLAPQEIADQIDATRGRAGATGNLLFSARALVGDRQGIRTLLGGGAYSAPSLVPRNPMMAAGPVDPPQVSLTGDLPDEVRMQVTTAAFLWVLYARDEAGWRAEVLPAANRDYAVKGAGRIRDLQVSAVDRLGNESARVVLR